MIGAGSRLTTMQQPKAQARDLLHSTPQYNSTHKAHDYYMYIRQVNIM
jgi:hypothetical protein